MGKQKRNKAIVFLFLVVLFAGGYYLQERRKWIQMIYPDPVIRVRIGGAVKNPGVYRLKEGSRLQDLLEEAGGLKKDTLLEENPGMILKDGQVIELNAGRN